MIAFDAPAWLMLFLLVPLRVVGRRTLLAPPSMGISSEILFRSVAGTGRARFLWITEGCLLGTLVLLSLALARPRLERERVVVEQGTREILLLVDLSSSMAERGLEPGRSDLEVVKAAARRFVEERTGDRVGLLTFARFPVLRVPFTSDHAALLQVLDRIETVPRASEFDGTALGAALAEAARLFEGTEEGRAERPPSSPFSGRTAVLFTDGEENQFVVDPLAGARLCKEMGVKVYAVVAAGKRSVSEEPGPSSVPGLIHEEVARITGGAFACAREGSEVEAICRRVDALEPSRSLRRTVREDRELSSWFLFTAALLLGAAGLLSGTVLSRFP